MSHIFLQQVPDLHNPPTMQRSLQTAVSPVPLYTEYDRLVGLVVKVSASIAADLGSISRFRHGRLNHLSKEAVYVGEHYSTVLSLASLSVCKAWDEEE